MALWRSAALLSAAGVIVFAAGASAQLPKPAATATRADAGKKLFVQRCSVCHLPPLGPGEPRSYARSLVGFVKTKEAESVVRQITLNGIPSRMPGFKYTLDATEIDQIVAYVSSLK
jgi:mono/diheme cytochrome c family protein